MEGSGRSRTLLLCAVGGTTVGLLALFEQFEAVLPAAGAWIGAHLVLSERR